MIRHKTTAYLWNARKPLYHLRNKRQKTNITEQFLFVIRLTVACHEEGKEFTLNWKIEPERAIVTIEVKSTTGIPKAKKLPKAKEK